MVLGLVWFSWAQDLEPNIDRPGGDLRVVDLAEPKPELCRDECARDPKCQSFTYVKPGVQGPQAKCRLKGSIPDPVPNDCCVSGVRADLTAVPLEENTDRDGMDYQTVDLKDANPALCYQACVKDPQCQSFTYLKPGLEGDQPRCRLKNGVPAPAPKDGHVSGVK
jgi:hypothetical protein